MKIQERKNRSYRCIWSYLSMPGQIECSHYRDNNMSFWNSNKNNLIGWLEIMKIQLWFGRSEMDFFIYVIYQQPLEIKRNKQFAWLLRQRRLILLIKLHFWNYWMCQYTISFRLQAIVAILMEEYIFNNYMKSLINELQWSRRYNIDLNVLYTVSERGKLEANLLSQYLGHTSYNIMLNFISESETFVATWYVPKYQTMIHSNLVLPKGTVLFYKRTWKMYTLATITVFSTVKTILIVLVLITHRAH